MYIQCGTVWSGKRGQKWRIQRGLSNLTAHTHPLSRSSIYSLFPFIPQRTPWRWLSFFLSKDKLWWKMEKTLVPGRIQQEMLRIRTSLKTSRVFSQWPLPQFLDSSSSFKDSSRLALIVKHPLLPLSALWGIFSKQWHFSEHALLCVLWECIFWGNWKRERECAFAGFPCKEGSGLVVPCLLVFSQMPLDQPHEWVCFCQNEYLTMASPTNWT